MDPKCSFFFVFSIEVFIRLYSIGLIFSFYLKRVRLGEKLEASDFRDEPACFIMLRCPAFPLTLLGDTPYCF